MSICPDRLYHYGGVPVDAAIDVREYGAVGDGVTDDTDAIQSAIDAVEADGTINTPDWAFRDVGGILIPEATFLVTGLTVKTPMSIMGISSTKSIIHSHTDAAIFTVQGHSDSLTAMEDIKTVFSRVAIIGSMSYGYDVPITKSSQHGIYVNSAEASTHGPRVEVHQCNIRHCGGHGIYSETAVSNRIYNSNITLNAMDGVHLTGTYNTDVRIMSCSIRRNRIGIHISPTATEYITTGLIANNLIESNRNGTGNLGSATRPAVGIQLLRTQRLVIRDNYFESHLNDVYCESNVSFCRFSQNYHDGGSLLLNVARDRRMAAYYLDGATNQSNVIEKSHIYLPSRPGTVTEANWDTATYGDEYEHIWCDSSIYLQVLRNIDRDSGTGLLIEITVGGGNHNIFEQIHVASATTEYKIEAPRLVRYGASIFDIDTGGKLWYESELTGADPPKIAYVHQHDMTDEFFRLFITQERAADDSLGSEVKAFGINDAGELAIPLDRALAFQYAAGNYFVSQSVAQTAPIAGDWVVGDIVWDRSPAAGSYLGWICTVAGTPGTWVEFGNVNLQGSDTWDPASIANGAEEAKEVTVTGAALGDFAIASFSLDVTDLVLNAQVTAANTVTCILANNTGGAIDLASGTIYVKVIKR